MRFGAGFWLVVVALILALFGAALDFGWIKVDEPYPLGVGLLSLAAFYAAHLAARYEGRAP